MKWNKQSCSWHWNAKKIGLCERSPRCRKLRNKIVYMVYQSSYGNCDLVDLYWGVPDLNLDRDIGYTEVVRYSPQFTRQVPTSNRQFSSTLNSQPTVVYDWTCFIFFLRNRKTTNEVIGMEEWYYELDVRTVLLTWIAVSWQRFYFVVISTNNNSWFPKVCNLFSLRGSIWSVRQNSIRPLTHAVIYSAILSFC